MEKFDIAVDLVGKGKPDLIHVQPVEDAFEVYTSGRLMATIVRNNGNWVATGAHGLRKELIGQIGSEIEKHTSKSQGRENAPK